MEKNSGTYLNRPIGENEEELLDEIWNSLPAAEGGVPPLPGDYRDIRQRIRRRAIRRRLVYISGSAAAIFLFLILLLHPGTPEESPVYAQLQEMGISICRQEVQLIVGDSLVANLKRSARIVDLDQRATLHSATGEKISLEQEKTLRIYVPAGKRFDLELADGTHVWLNSESRFEYPATFASAPERRVKIEGEGFFEVAPDAAKPFFAELPGGESIRVLGTSFNVSAYADNEENITTLVSGKIEYLAPTRSEAITLSPDEQVRVNKATREVMKNRVNGSESALWKEGILCFNDEELPALARRLSRMYGIEIVVAEQHNDARFSGMIRYERGIDYITQLLTTTSNITYSVKEGVIYLN